MGFLGRFFRRVFGVPKPPDPMAGSPVNPATVAKLPTVPLPVPVPPKASAPEPSPYIGQWWQGPVSLASRTGVRHLNPLNVKAPSETYWRRQIGRDSRGHAIFADPADGIRAAVVLLRTYGQAYHLHSVAEILSRWAPVSDTVGSLPGAPANSPAEYARFVERKTGLNPLENLRLFKGGKVNDRRNLADLITAMAEYEIGSGFQLNPDVVQRGIDRL